MPLFRRKATPAGSAVQINFPKEWPKGLRVVVVDARGAACDISDGNWIMAESGMTERFYPISAEKMKELYEEVDSEGKPVPEPKPAETIDATLAKNK